MRKVLYLLTFLSISFHGISCTCVGENTVEQEMKESDFVFAGTVIGAEKIVQGSEGDESSYMKFVFHLEVLYKGEYKSSNIEVITGMGEDDCGYRFELNKKYIVYSKYQDQFFIQGEIVTPFLYTSDCTLTKEMDERGINYSQSTMIDYLINDLSQQMCEDNGKFRIRAVSVSKNLRQSVVDTFFVKYEFNDQGDTLSKVKYEFIFFTEKKEFRRKIRSKKIKNEIEKKVVYAVIHSQEAKNTYLYYSSCVLFKDLLRNAPMVIHINKSVSLGIIDNNVVVLAVE